MKQNQEHRLGANKNSQSGVRGVWWDKHNHMWCAGVMHHGQSHWLGRFPDKELAEAAAIAKRNELYTHNPEQWDG